MKFKCCKSAISSFYLLDNSLSYCACLIEESRLSFLDNYDGKINFIEEYIRSRKQFIENCKKGENIPSICQNCADFVEADWDERIGIDYIGILTRNKCSCDCIYCIVTRGSTDLRRKINKNDKKLYDIKSVLTSLAENNLLKTGEKTIYIAGGEPSEYPEEKMKWLLEYAYKLNLFIQIPTSGFRYSQEIEQSLKENKIELIVSVDAGTKETHKRIKRINYYEQLWKNLGKYIQVSKNNPNAVVSAKYIIVDGLNSNIEEFKAFLQKCDNCDCKHIIIDVDYLNAGVYKNIKSKEETIKLLNQIENLNDERFTLYIKKQYSDKKISAKEYSKNIEDAIKNGCINLTIVVFSGTKATYKKLTGTDCFETIWENIKKYSLCAENTDSSVRIQYKLIANKNDDITEFHELLNKCHSCYIKNINIDIYDRNNINFTKEKIQQITDFLNNEKEIDISFSNRFLLI